MIVIICVCIVSILCEFFGFMCFKIGCTFFVLVCSVLQVIVVKENSQVTCPITTKLVLDEDEETKEPIVEVHKNLVTKLKPHQVDGTKRVKRAE